MRPNGPRPLWQKICFNRFSSQYTTVSDLGCRPYLCNFSCLIGEFCEWSLPISSMATVNNINKSTCMILPISWNAPLKSIFFDYFRGREQPHVPTRRQSDDVGSNKYCTTLLLYHNIFKLKIMIFNLFQQKSFVKSPKQLHAPNGVIKFIATTDGF